MRRTAGIAIAAGTALLLAGSAAEAQYEKTKSTLVIAERVEVPGAILEPGNYLVRVADVQANRNVVVFQSPDGTKTYATCLATPHPEAAMPSTTEFAYYSNVPEGQPRVLRSWFPANVSNGQDFYYPPARAAELRKLNQEEVPVTAAAAPMPVAPAPEPPRPAPPPPVPVETTAVNAAEPAPETLPQTASPYPLIALLGTASLAAAFAASRLRRTA